VTTDAVPEIAVSTWSIDLAHSSLHFEIRHMAIASVRDEHLRSATFPDVEYFPSMRSQSTRISRGPGDVVVMRGEFTIRGPTRAAELDVTEVSSPTRDPWGNVRLAASAKAQVNRKEFGLTWNTALEAGGFLVGDDVFVDLDLEFMKAAG
jgi:polyisoprenoid-binding protein YceI